MIDGAAVDVAIGVVLLFLIASLLASALVEAVGGFFHRRSKNLWDTIDLLLGQSRKADDEKLVDMIYRQPYVTKLVQPKSQKLYPRQLQGGARKDVRSRKSHLAPTERDRRFHGPQHLPPQTFAKAFIESIRPGGNVDANVEKLRSTVKELPEAISEPVGAVLADVGDDFVAARGRIERWYEEHMQAVSIWYRRQTRYFLFIAGLVIAVTVNVDPVTAATTLYRDEALRESVLAQAEAIGTAECDDESAAEERIDCLNEELGGAVTLPVGWSGAEHSMSAWIQRIIGWALVAGAVTVGAPFWFDLLRRGLAHRRGAAQRS